MIIFSFFFKILSIYDYVFLLEIFLVIFTFSYLIILCFSTQMPKGTFVVLFDKFKLFLIMYILFELFLFFFKRVEFFHLNLSLFNKMFVLNISIFLIKIFLVFIYFFCYQSLVRYIINNQATTKFFYEFFLIIINLLFLSVLFISVSDFTSFIPLFIGINIHIYILLAIDDDFGRMSREAVIKYFLMSGLSTGFFLMGIRDIYILSGTFNFKLINNFIFEFIINNTIYSSLFPIKLVFIFFLSGFCFKISVAPSYNWAPEVYNGISFTFIHFLILPIKFIYAFILFKLFKSIFIINSVNSYINFLLYNEIDFIISLIIINSLIISSSLITIESDLKRYIAYSSINQMSFLLIGLLGYELTYENLHSFFYFIITYIINMLMFFYIISYINFFNIWTGDIKDVPIFGLKQLNDFKDIFYFQNISISNYKVFPLHFYLLLILIICSLASIPPLPGSFAKLFIFSYAITIEHYFVVIIGLLVSGISAYYYLRILKIIFFEKNYYDIIPKEFIEFNFNDSFYYVNIYWKRRILIHYIIQFSCLLYLILFPFYIDDIICLFCFKIIWFFILPW